MEAGLAAYEGVAILRLDDSDDGADGIALVARVKRANEWGADLYLSIHHNAGINGGSGGGIVAAIHGEENFAKINLKQAQYYAIQGE